MHGEEFCHPQASDSLTSGGPTGWDDAGMCVEEDGVRSEHGAIRTERSHPGVIVGHRPASVLGGLLGVSCM